MLGSYKNQCFCCFKPGNWQLCENRFSMKLTIWFNWFWNICGLFCDHFVFWSHEVPLVIGKDAWRLKHLITIQVMTLLLSDLPSWFDKTLIRHSSVLSYVMFLCTPRSPRGELWKQRWNCWRGSSWLLHDAGSSSLRLRTSCFQKDSWDVWVLVLFFLSFARLNVQLSLDLGVFSTWFCRFLFFFGRCNNKHGCSSDWGPAWFCSGPAPLLPHAGGAQNNRWCF